MAPLDLLVIGVYLVALLSLGAKFASHRGKVRDYFLSDRPIPWWALLGSIVATETSTVTLISVPGYAFGNDLTFLQLVLGYVVARILVAAFLLPVFFKGERLTAYQYLTERFSPAVGRLFASIFLATRFLSDGFRLFAAAVVLATVFTSVPTIVKLEDLIAVTGNSRSFFLVLSVFLIGVTTLIYTLLGGIRAVIWADVIQLAIYSSGTLLLGFILLKQIPGGWTEVVETASPAMKFTLFDFTMGLTKSYTFWSGLIGGLFLTAATHGTDQLFVQRYLCCSSLSDARRALTLSGLVIFIQFALFLVIGVMLWVYYTNYAPHVLNALTVGGTIQTDDLLPQFMMSHLPIGIRGLFVAAIVAAAMSTLSSSLNSSAASTIGDFYLPWTRSKRSDQHYLRASQVATIAWGMLQIVMALIAMRLSSRVVDEVLGIQSFSGGLTLGAFLLALLPSSSSRSVIISTLVGANVLLFTRLFTAVSWQWYAVIGTLVTAAVGWSLSQRSTNHSTGHRL